MTSLEALPSRGVRRLLGGQWLSIISANLGLSPIPAAVVEGHRFLLGRRWLVGNRCGAWRSMGFNGFDDFGGGFAFEGCAGVLGVRGSRWWPVIGSRSIDPLDIVFL
jgi:hypothetical protein